MSLPVEVGKQKKQRLQNSHLSFPSRHHRPILLRLPYGNKNTGRGQAEGRKVTGTCGELSRLLEVGQGDMAEDVQCCKQKC